MMRDKDTTKKKGGEREKGVKGVGDDPGDSKRGNG